MRCKNVGSDYETEDIQWTCSASLPDDFKLGSTDVICEGYDGPDDPYVLKGSCGVEYRLVLTDAGEQKYGRNAFERVYRQPSGRNAAGALFSLLFWGVFIAVICIFVYKTCVARAATHPPPGNDSHLGWNGDGSGGGDDGGDDGQPPPYHPQAPKPKADHRANSGRPDSQDQQRGRDGQWRPGFWSGAAAGAAATYAGNALSNTLNANRTNRTRGYDHDPLQTPEAGPSSWFGRQRGPSPSRRYDSRNYGGGARSSFFGGGGDGGGPFNSGATGGRGSPAYGAGGASTGSVPAPSSSRHESTGFGSTRRR
ncbi:hypothetical protein LTR02_011488 [Friedmanniomyces endolithicus]|nr:hypothetical protein LTR59_016820 [Friedmanniomyces endolithicus]KAK0803366.1 hypothetical protein LTR38_006226 [Friedmanniomyces endolithicus]KAK0838820.1 hypothetical protein LTR03_011739 [Friedmanniomyces endolithicus]KAK0849606.1 hypothetical protein LTS02_013530 [Friedmanniomyces endolithicus]KAK0896015.1 hypothetical protein LTR02_011488 [Friedmanniomyces endolithicus]